MPGYNTNPYYQTQPGNINFAPNTFQTAMPTPKAPSNTGVSREEFESLSKKLDKLLSELGGEANG